MCLVVLLGRWAPLVQLNLEHLVDPVDLLHQLVQLNLEHLAVLLGLLVLVRLEDLLGRSNLEHRLVLLGQQVLERLVVL